MSSTKDSPSKLQRLSNKPKPLHLKGSIGRPSGPFRMNSYESQSPNDIGVAITTNSTAPVVESRSPIPPRPHRPKDLFLSTSLDDVAIPSPTLRPDSVVRGSTPSLFCASEESLISAKHGPGRRLTPPTLPAPSGTEDIAGDIQFRSQILRSPYRTLYANTSALPSPATRSSSIYSASGKSSPPLTDTRRPSLVNPDDYLPGLPSSANPGKAMAAGFDPVRPVPSVRSASPKHSNIPPLRRISAASQRSQTASIVSFDDKSIAGNSDLDLDLGDLSSENGYDASKVFGMVSADGNEETIRLPTLYNNSYGGSAGLAKDGKTGIKRDLGLTEMPNGLPRDPTTGKIDWRARLHIKSTSGQPRDMEKTSNSSVFGLDEKYAASEASYGSTRPTPNVIDLQSKAHSATGRFLLRLSPFTYVVAQAAMVFYLFTRCTYIIRASKATGQTFASAWLFFASEALFAIWTFSHATYQLANLNIKGKPKYTIKGDIGLPTVDVLILSTGQDISMIMDATIAAARLDWPVDKLRVLVVDETGSIALQRSVENYAHSRAIHVTYHRRGRQSMLVNYSDPSRVQKSSTVNFGLTETRAEGRVSGEYAVILEGESIPENDMLRLLLPHLLKSPLTALVRTPTGFYNLPKKLGMAFSTFVRCVEPESDSHSGFIVRRSAIDDIGGFPTRSSIEDGRLESLLQGKGYRTTWIDETVQYSMVPDSFSGHLRQRVARELAHFGTAARLGFFMFGSKTRNMPFGARLAGLGRAFAPFLSILIFLNMMAFPVCLFYGGFLIPALSLSELNVTVWAALAAVMAERLHDFFSAMPAGHSSARRFVQSQVFMAPYTILALLRSLVPSFLRRAPEPYWVPSEYGEAKERDSKIRKPLGRRLGSVLFSTHGWVHLVVVSGLLAAIGYSLYDSIKPFALGHRSLHQTGLLVLMTVAWPTLPWMNVLLGSLVPFIYALFPPSVPSRERLLHREPISTVARPLHDVKRDHPFRERYVGQFVLSFLLVGYICAVFALTFVDLHVN